MKKKFKGIIKILLALLFVFVIFGCQQAASEKSTGGSSGSGVNYSSNPIVTTWAVQTYYGHTEGAFYYFYSNGTGKFGSMSSTYKTFTYTLPTATSIKINEDHNGFLTAGTTYNFTISTSGSDTVLDIPSTVYCLKKTEI